MLLVLSFMYALILEPEYKVYYHKGFLGRAEPILMLLEDQHANYEV